jgi:hypothetical protein
MAHKAKVEITDVWGDLSTLIEGYSSSNDYNIQVLTSGKIGFSYSPIEPEASKSCTICKQYEIYVLPRGSGKIWARMLDGSRMVLSIEEIIGVIGPTPPTPVPMSYIWTGAEDGDLGNPNNYELLIGNLGISGGLISMGTSLPTVIDTVTMDDNYNNIPNTGTLTCSVFYTFGIEGGTYNCEIRPIEGFSFNIYDGIFNGKVYCVNDSRINYGTFNQEVNVVNSEIGGGTFTGAVNVSGPDSIVFGGSCTFSGAVTLSEGNINGGTILGTGSLQGSVPATYVAFIPTGTRGNYVYPTNSCDIESADIYWVQADNDLGGNITNENYIGYNPVEFTWLGNSGDLDDPSNYSPSSIPISGDIVYMENPDVPTYPEYGTCEAEVYISGGDIYGGTYNGVVHTAYCTIYSGEFNGYLDFSFSVIQGGTFSDLVNLSYSSCYAGLCTGAMYMNYAGQIFDITMEGTGALTSGANNIPVEHATFIPTGSAGNWTYPTNNTVITTADIYWLQADNDLGGTVTNENYLGYIPVEYTWTGSTNGDLDISTNYSPEGIPTIYDKLTIDAGSPNYPKTGSSAASVVVYTYGYIYGGVWNGTVGSGGVISYNPSMNNSEYPIFNNSCTGGVLEIHESGFNNMNVFVGDGGVCNTYPIVFSGATLDKGVFNETVIINAGGVVNGGTYNFNVENYGTISGGTFSVSGAVTGDNTGTIHYDPENNNNVYPIFNIPIWASKLKISSGIFDGTEVFSGDSGVFNETVEVYNNASVVGGVFTNVVTFNDSSYNEVSITNGTFNGSSYNHGTVTNGTFKPISDGQGGWTYPINNGTVDNAICYWLEVDNTLGGTITNPPVIYAGYIVEI